MCYAIEIALQMRFPLARCFLVRVLLDNKERIGYSHFVTVLLLRLFSRNLYKTRHYTFCRRKYHLHLLLACILRILVFLSKFFLSPFLNKAYSAYSYKILSRWAAREELPSFKQTIFSFPSSPHFLNYSGLLGQKVMYCTT